MSLETIYLVCAIAGGTILVLRLILMIVGFDFGGGDVPDVDVVMDIDAPDGDIGHDAGGFNLLSIQSIAGFFTLFGLVGLGLLQVEVTPLWSMIGALGAGLVTAWATAMIFAVMQRLQSEGTLVLGNAVGQEGTVYLSIPEKGTGTISVKVQGSLRNLDAVSKTGQRIPTGAIVRVVGVTGGNILVVTDQQSDSN